MRETASSQIAVQTASFWRLSRFGCATAFWKTGLAGEVSVFTCFMGVPQPLPTPELPATFETTAIDFARFFLLKHP